MRRMNEWPEWPNARDWIGLGVFLLTVMILWMVKEDPTLRNDEFFKTIATLIIGTGLVNGVVAWAFSATKGGGELADANAEIAKKAAETPKTVTIDQPEDQPIPVEETKK